MGGWRAGGVGDVAAVSRWTYGGSRGRDGSGYGASSTAQQRRAAVKNGFEELAPAAIDAGPFVEGQGGRGSSNSSGKGRGSGGGVGDGSGDKTVVIPIDSRAVAAAESSDGISAVAATAVGAAVPVTPPRLRPSAFGPRDALPLSPQSPSQPRTPQHPQHPHQQQQQQCGKMKAPGGVPMAGQTVPDAASADAIAGVGGSDAAAGGGLVATRAPAETEACVGGGTDAGTNGTRGAVHVGGGTNTAALPRAPLPPYRSPVQRRLIHVKVSS